MVSLENVWPEWRIEKQIGKGSFGGVYQAIRQDKCLTSRAAIKIISIPRDSYELESLRSEGLDLSASRTYIKSLVDDFVNEIRIMESLNGNQNIVSILDYKVVERKEEIGWDIYIRMELLMPLNAYICDKRLTEREVIRLGCDICTALEACEKRNIIHRDIKPENIFVNDFGFFKLGDFGTACTMENLTGYLSQKGSYNYMAPEVISGKEYDRRVDIYSLGLVLYRFMNGNRMPFISENQLVSSDERRNAFGRRIHGEKLPVPCEASPALAEVILRACAFSPEERYSGAAELKEALQKAGNLPEKVFNKPTDGTLLQETGPDNRKSGKSAESNAKGKQKKYKLLLGIGVVGLLAVAGIVITLALKTAGEVRVNNPIPDEEQDTSPIPDEEQDISPSPVPDKEQDTVIRLPTSENFHFDGLVFTCIGAENPETGAGYNAKGEVVNACLWIEFDMQEKTQKVYRPTVTGSWGHIINGGDAWEMEADFDTAKGGKTYAEFGSLKSKDGREKFVYMIILPDDSSISGEQSVTLQVGHAQKTIFFTLVYEGDYENGTGWQITDITY